MTYGSIVIDPPWQYPNKTLWQRPQSVPEKHYDTLSLDDIKTLPIIDLADRNCALWLWIPSYHLLRGIGVEVLDAWNHGQPKSRQFRPMTTMVWCKSNIGLGHYIRNAHENILLAVRGKYSLKVKDQKSWFLAKRTRHSKKPDVFLDIVERCCHGPYVEVFARRPRPGWDSIGFDIDGQDIRDVLKSTKQ